MANTTQVNSFLTIAFLEMSIKMTIFSLNKKVQEELVLNSVESIVQLFSKVEEITELQLDKVGQLFIFEKSLKVRQTLAQGLNNLNKLKVGQLLVWFNSIKKGSAEIEIDFDLCLKAMT